MRGYVQRYAFVPKAVWWKRLDDKASINEKRTIYVATETIGFEISGFQKFVKLTLVNGELENASENTEIEYIQLTYTNDDEEEITRNIYFLGKYFEYNSETEEMEEQDFVDTDGNEEIYEAEVNSSIRIEKNTYVKKFAFDCIKDESQQDGNYQPLQGLIIDSSYISLKSQNFGVQGDKPKKGDLLFYQGRFWMVEDIQRQSWYCPRERITLHFSLKAINK